MQALVNSIRRELFFVHELRFESDKMIIMFITGDELIVPLAWFPALYYATPRQISRWRIVGKGMNIRWPELDTDVSVDELIGQQKQAAAMC